MSTPSGISSDNLIQPFQLESSNLRGRSVRLGSVLDDILSAHDYPKPVAHLVAETVTLASLLSSMLKYDGIFTLQAQGDGPVKMLAADVTSDGDVRGCATFDAERLERSREQLQDMKSSESSQNHLAQYLGKGHIAFTVDQEADNVDRYQGIVELHGSSLVDCVQHYFQQSEQIGTGIKMAVGERGGRWRAGGIMLQNMPDEDDAEKTSLGNMDEDDWRRSMILLDSCTEDEFLDPDLVTEGVLFRLFHEEGVRVYEPKALQKACRCSEERVEGVLLMMSEEDRDYMIVDGVLTMHCEFCGHDYVYSKEQLENILKAGAKS